MTAILSGGDGLKVHWPVHHDGDSFLQHSCPVTIRHGSRPQLTQFVRYPTNPLLTAAWRHWRQGQEAVDSGGQAAEIHLEIVVD